MSLVTDVDSYVKKSKAVIGDFDIEHVHNDISYYFNLSPQQIEKMDKEEFIRAQYFIMQYSISITKKLNTIKSLLLANQKEFNRALSQVYNSYNSFNGSTMIHSLACSEHEHLRQMDDEITKLEALIQEYEGITFKAEKLAQIFRDLSFCRK